MASTFPGYPAANAGLTTGDVITAVNGIPVTTATQLSAAIQAHKVGDSVTLSYTDASGAAHSAVITLVGGPAA